MTTQYFKIASISLMLLVPTHVFSSDDHDHEAEHKPHEHGAASLNIAMEGNKITMEFSSPGMDIVGFEYAAKTDDEKSAVKKALTQLENANELIKLPEAAECSLTSAHANLGDDDHHKDHEENHDDHDHDHKGHDESKEEPHNEFIASYEFSCKDMDKLDTIAFPYFTVFSKTREIDVQLISEKGTKGFEVTPDNPHLKM